MGAASYSHGSGSYGPRFEANPLLDDAPEVWDQLVEALSPAAMLVAIRHRMGRDLLHHLSPEDVWQETLMHVWRDRSRCEWHGVAAFKRWVLSVAENRIRNAVDRAGATKRGGGVVPVSLETRNPDALLPPPVLSTTPSRVASYTEEANLMREALLGLPDDLREVVRLRYFEELPVDEIAARLSLGSSAVKHRFRKGASLYHSRVQKLLDLPTAERDGDE